VTDKRKKLIIAIVAVLLVALIVNAVLSWGIIFDCGGGFERSTTHNVFADIFTDIHATQMRLGEDPSNPIGIPLVFLIYGIEPPPYAIILRINDKTVSFQKMFIESISIEYTDGQKTEHTVDWERAFFSSSVLESIGGGRNAKFPVMGLSEKLPVTVNRRESCNIRFVGYFVKKGGEKIPFDTTEYFKYEPKKWRIYTGRGAFLIK
jgi:hypothetical protein